MLQILFLQSPINHITNGFTIELFRVMWNALYLDCNFNGAVEPNGSGSQYRLHEAK